MTMDAVKQGRTVLYNIEASEDRASRYVTGALIESTALALQSASILGGD